MKSFFKHLAWGLLAWLLMMACVGISVNEIDDTQWKTPVEYEIRPTMIKEGYFLVHKFYGIDYYYPRKVRF